MDDFVDYYYIIIITRYSDLYCETIVVQTQYSCCYFPRLLVDHPWPWAQLALQGEVALLLNGEVLLQTGVQSPVLAPR